MHHMNNGGIPAMESLPDHMRFLNHLAKAYPSLEAVAEAIINLQAQLNLRCARDAGVAHTLISTGWPMPTSLGLALIRASV